MGADVVKVEKMDGGDQTRQMLPPAINGEPAAYMMMNRNKRGVVIDLKKEGGRKALKRLLETADIVTENYRADTMPRLGMGYDEIRKVNPGIIYASISGFGRSGPYAELGGFDLVAQGMSGLMSITGEGPGRPPVKVGAPVCDITAGMLLAMGILAAYTHRLRTGEGQMVDTSLFEAGISHTYWQSAIAFATGVAPTAMGSAHPLNAPYQAYKTRDGYINLGAANAKNWKIMLDAVGAPQLADDPRFRTNGDRMSNLGPLQEELEKVFTANTSKHWLELMEKVGVPAGPIFDVMEMHRDPQTLAREMVVEVDHPKAGRVKTIGLPIKFSETPGKVAAPAPVFGQHTREVLLEHGFTQAEIARLADEKAILLGDALQAAAE
jgi:crotonobetainyl-CoA:carnitine CoA-transferase CaiB-like acyl-CoA transferase